MKNTIEIFIFILWTRKRWEKSISLHFFLFTFRMVQRFLLLLWLTRLLCYWIVAIGNKRLNVESRKLNRTRTLLFVYNNNNCYYRSQNNSNNNNIPLGTRIFFLFSSTPLVRAWNTNIKTDNSVRYCGHKKAFYKCGNRFWIEQ